MTATPARGVHWDVKDLSPSLLNSPLFEGSTESYISTSSLEYVNAQLVAHGFIPSPGLSLEGLSGTDSDRVVKCLLGMLSQRVEDMSRTEQLSTKFRTLTYDHERLLTMQRTANEKAANAEREMNLYKTKLTATTRTLQSSEAAHKQTTSELQRTRTSLQTLRATHQTELRKKEKDIERMTEKWGKISDSQAKLASIPAGLRCANVAILDGSEFMAKSQSYLENALDEAEKARTQLTDETMRLRRLVLKVVNQVQALLHQVRAFISNKDEEPTIWTLTNLFPMHPPTHAHDTLTSILNSLKDTLAALPQHIASSPSISPKPPQSDHDEIAHLQDTISRLREEIEQSQKQSQAHAAETQAMFDKFVADHRKASDITAEMSMELMTAPMMDEERTRLDQVKRELDEEREKFTQAAIKLGRERAAIEAERTKLMDEKRSWQVQQMLADLPPTPDPLQPHQSDAPTQQHKSPRKATQTHVHIFMHSPSKKSPRKARRSSTATRKTTRVSRRPSITPIQPTVIPPYETELISPQPQFQLQDLQAPPPPPPLAAPSFSSLKPTSSILPSFVLPPPSPYASLPSKPILPPQSISPPDFGGNDTLDMHVPPEESAEPIPFTTAKPSVTTPVRRPFPMAKPFAQRMTHAYSPAKPSPLSRILMLNDSPNTPEEISSSDNLSPGLEVVREEVEDRNPFPVIPETPQPQLSLAAELGVESPPEIIEIVDIPLKEKKAEVNGRTKASSKPGINADPAALMKKPSVSGVKERPQSRTSAESTKRPAATSGRTPHGDGTEKENGMAATRTVGGKASRGAATTSNTARVVSRSGRPSKPSSAAPKSNPTGPTTKTKVVPKPVAITAGVSTGPRRVPINSAEAPPIARRRS